MLLHTATPLHIRGNIVFTTQPFSKATVTGIKKPAFKIQHINNKPVVPKRLV